MKIHDTDFDDYLVACVAIDENALLAEYMRVGADLAYWSRKHGEAEQAYVLAKANAKRAEGQAYEEARAMLDRDESVTRVTEDRVKFRMPQMGVYTDAHQRLASAARWRAETRGYLDAIHTKRDMLISLGADLRKEREQDPYIRNRDNS
jgi:hypothetical protein